VSNYYTHFRDRPHKEDDLFWEGLMAEWEGKAAEALRQLEADPEHIRGPAQALLVLQVMRTPLGQAQIDFRCRACGTAAPLLEADATVILDEMMSVLTRSGFGERLDEGDWNILHADPDQFVIGDEPVTYSGQSEPARPIWAQTELPAQLTMPISPGRAIEVRRAPRRLGHIDDGEVEDINLRVVEWATRFIYGPDPQHLVEVRTRWRERGSKAPPPVDASRRRRR
jgi:Protein of unknown function (DUF4238)